MEDISTQEAVNILQRLVNERRALEKGLEVASLLAGSAQSIQEHSAQLAALKAQCAEQQIRLDEIAENISDIHQQREFRLRERETQAEQKVQAAQAKLDDIQTQSEESIEHRKRVLSELDTKHLELAAKYHRIEQDLSTRIAVLQETLANLRKQVKEVQLVAGG
jgi:chromosome segregation ATPase